LAVLTLPPYTPSMTKTVGCVMIRLTSDCAPHESSLAASHA